MSHPLATLIDELRNALFAKETLPPPPEHAPAARPRPSLGRMLFAIEPLPFEPERAPRRRAGLLAILFAPEPLPRDPEGPPPRAHTRWLTWLFLPERLDRTSDSHEVD